MRIWPMLTRATTPFGLPKAPRIPVWSLSAPAHDNILLMRTTWKGWARTRRWKPSFPVVLTRYLAKDNYQFPLRFLDSIYLPSLGFSLVGADTGGLEGLRAQLFILVGDQVDAEREVIDGRTLSAKVEDSDLGVGHTTVKPRLGVRLFGKSFVSKGCPRKSQDHRKPQILRILHS